ncbi:MAG: hypothetical protein Kow0059_12640 [Candidatus Sumerlaeia bacterium]
MTLRSAVRLILTAVFIPWLASCALWERPLSADEAALTPEQRWAHENKVSVGRLMDLDARAPNLEPREKEIVLAYHRGVSLKHLDRVKAKRLNQFTPDDVDLFAAWLQQVEPSLQARVRLIALKGLGQKYNIFLLGEAPVEIWDPQPLYTFEQSDCVVFVEHVYALALAYDWRSFFALLQRIRYKNGEISNLTRNHFSLVDWDTNNAWLVRDISRELAGERARGVQETSGRRRFFAKNKGIPPALYETMEESTVQTWYVPADVVPDILDQLQDGDLIHVIRANDKGVGWCQHFGLVIRGEDGSVNMLHSTPPRVKIQTIQSYLDGQARANERRREKGETPFVGLKFLRLTDDPIAALKALDGPDAPLVTAPRGLYR